MTPMHAITIKWDHIIETPLPQDIAKRLEDAKSLLNTACEDIAQDSNIDAAQVARQIHKVNEATSKIYLSLITQEVKYSYPCFDTEIETLSQDDQALSDLENILAGV